MKDNKVQMKEYSIITNNNLENNTHNISLQQSSVNRNQSPTLYTEKIKSLGRK